MALPIVIYKNFWRDGAILSASSENPQFPAEYTQDDSRMLFTRTLDVTGAKTWVCDLGEALEYDFAGILGHNFTSGATPIKVEGADDAAFTIAVVSDTLTYNGNNIFETLAAARTKRYIRLSVTDGANPSAYLQIGVIVIGKGGALNRFHSQGYQEGQLNATEVEFSPSMNMFTVQERPGVEAKVLQFNGLNDVSAVVIKALIAECGIHKGWVIGLDAAAMNTSSTWVHLTELELPICQHNNFWTWAASISEIV